MLLLVEELEIRAGPRQVCGFFAWVVC